MGDFDVCNKQNNEYHHYRKNATILTFI